jgi:hypothetical protein
VADEQHDMTHARAVVAGVISMGIVLLMVSPGPLREPERAASAFIGLLAVVVLMMGIDPRQKP